MRTTTVCFTALLLLGGCKNKYDEVRRELAKKDAGWAIGPFPANATLLASGQNVPRDLELDSTHLYWLNEGRRAEGTPGIYKVAKGGGEVAELVRGAGIHAIAVDDESVYFIHPEQGALLKVSKTGGAPQTLAAEQDNLSTLELDAAHVYWSGADGIFRVPKAGGKPTPVAQNLSLPSGLEVDREHVYWYSVMSGKLARAPAAGGPPIPLVSEEVTLHAFFLDDTHLFWSFGADTKAQLKRMAKSGGTPSTVATGQQVPADFAVDQTHVYWNTESALFRVPKAGGAVEAVVSGADRAIELAVDETHVYWTDRMGRVQKVAK